MRNIAHLLIHFSLNVPSRLKGMETFKGAMSTARLVSLNVPSRLKGMETDIDVQEVSGVCVSLNVPSRLKGMETILN